MNGRYLRELSRRRADRARWRRSPAATGLRAAVAISREKIQTLADFWPLAGFIFDGPADDPTAREKWLGDDGRARARATARDALRGVDPFDVGGDRGGAARRRRGARRQARRASSSRSASRSPGTTVSPGIFETLAVLGRDESLRADRRGALRLSESLDRRSIIRPCAADSGVVRPSAAVDRPSRRRPIMNPRPPPAACHRRTSRPRRCRAPPQRGPRPSADRRLRGARGVPGARRVAQPPAAPRQRPSASRAGDVVAAVESDVALVIAVLRLANQVEGQTPRPRRVGRQGRRAALARGRPGARRPRPHLRLLRALDRLGRRARALPPARRRHPARRRPPRHRGRLRAPRPPDGHRAAARHRQARPDARLPGLPGPGPRRRPHARGAHPPRAPRARRRPRAGRRRPRPPLGPAEGGRLRRSSATTPTTPTARPPSSASPTCSPTTPRAAPSRRPSCCKCARAVGLGPTELRTVMYDLPYPTTGRAAPDRPVPAVGPRGRGAQAPGRGQGLQADRARARRSRRARCAPTCTTSTASSAPSTAPRPC